MNVPQDIVIKITKLLELRYTKGSIVRAIKKESGSKEKAIKYYESVKLLNEKLDRADPSRVRARGLSDFRIGILLIALGLYFSYFIGGGFGFLASGIIILFFGLANLLKK